MSNVEKSLPGTLSSPVSQKATRQTTRSPSLPVINNLRWAYWLSALIGLLTAGACLAGLFLPESVYPTADLREHFLANDVVTLFIGLPLLLGSMWLTHRGRLIGLLFWPGALFFGLYNYIIYLFGMPFNGIFPLYLAIVSLSIYALIGLVAVINGPVVKEQLIGRVPERLSAGVMIGLGILIILFALGGIAGALTGRTEIARPDLALHVADFLTAGAWIIGGFFLWQKRPLGYVAGVGILFQGSMLFVGLLVVFLLQPLLTGASFAPLDFVLVSVMGLICFIPFFLFLRGVIKAKG